MRCLIILRISSALKTCGVSHHAQGYMKVLLHPADEEVVRGLVVPVFPHKLFKGGQQRL